MHCRQNLYSNRNERASIYASSVKEFNHTKVVILRLSSPAKMRDALATLDSFLYYCSGV